jgi:glycerol-3-phosphate dehydrogenase (NAD(P)+)
VTGAELGGALKNVIAIAAGIVIGAGLGDSARAALMTRGYAEITRLALALGARLETLAGLSGFGDLVLTCTSAQSRNFRFGQALGRGERFDARITVEGAATARAVTDLTRRRGIEVPVTDMVTALIAGDIALPQAVSALLSRPLKQE